MHWAGSYVCGTLVQGTRPVIPVRKTLRLCEVLVKIPLLASTRKKKRLDGVTPLLRRRFCLWRGYPAFSSFELFELFDFLKRRHFYSLLQLSDKRDIHGNLPLHCWIKPRLQRWHHTGTKWELPAGSWDMTSWLSWLRLSCGQGMH